MTVSQKGGQNCVPKGSAVKNNYKIIVNDYMKVFITNIIIILHNILL